MKRLLRGLGCGVLASVLLLPCVAWAQGRGGRGPGGPGGPGGGGMIGLLQSDEVRQELDLMDDQVEQLRTIGDDVRNQVRSELQDAFQGLRDLSPEDRQKRIDEIRAKVDTIVSQSQGRLQEVLLPHQFERLKQIDLQSRIQRGGPSALTEGELAETLGLTDQQKEQLRQRSQEVQQELQQKIQQLRTEARGKLMEVLTPEQRTKLESMLGEEFAVPDQPGGGRFFGRGGRRGQGGRGVAAPGGSQTPPPAGADTSN
jgi:Spy/CpxP family protein refolding chaperone